MRRSRVPRISRVAHRNRRVKKGLIAVMLGAMSLAPLALAAPENRPADEPLVTPPAADADATAQQELRELSRRHFESGIRLYEDRNYEGALAEFEAAYRSFPSASALQNVALCQKELYRYSEAKESLTRLMREHARELTEPERKAVRDVIGELASLVGTVRLSVIPKQARVSLDGRSLSAEERDQAVSLDVGEHRVTAEADGFAPLSRVFRVAGGHTDVPLELRLVETTGTVEVHAPDPQTAIAIDGRPVAFAFYRGRLEPGRHFVQIYREGFEPYEEEVEVKVGEVLRVQGELGEPTETVSTSASIDRKPTAKRTLRGFYGLGTFSLLTVRGSPNGFNADSNYDPGYELGLRAGYRLATPLGFEALVSSGTFVIQGHCSRVEATACSSAAATVYHLETRRIGAGVRFMSEGEGLRLFSVLNGGIVAQDFRAYGRHASGSGPYASLELGVTMNYRHSLWELALLGIFDEAEQIRTKDFTPYESRGGIQLLGMSLRFGWSDWAPPRKVPPMPERSTPVSNPPSDSTSRLAPPSPSPSP